MFVKRVRNFVIDLTLTTNKEDLVVETWGVSLDMSYE